MICAYRLLVHQFLARADAGQGEAVRDTLCDDHDVRLDSRIVLDSAGGAKMVRKATLKQSAERTDKFLPVRPKPVCSRVGSSQ